MFVYVNDQFLPEAEAKISVLDRAFLYGDGLFETIRVRQGQIFCLPDHLQRLKSSASFFQIPLPRSEAQLAESAVELIQRNQLPNAMLRIQLSRGVGPRGYSPTGCNTPALIMTLHPAPQIPSDHPPAWRLATVPWRISSSDPTLRHKTCSKMLHVLARAEAERRGFDDALLLNDRQQIAETTCSNCFWIAADAIHTPPIAAGVLPGITRNVVLRLGREIGIPTFETAADLDTLRKAEGIFLTLSSWGIVEVRAVDDIAIPAAPQTEQLWRAYEELIRRQPTVSSTLAQSA